MIYLLEDDANIRTLVRVALEKDGFRVREFEEAGAFREALAEQLPDLVLMDIMLPGEDGISVLRNMRESKATRLVPVIFLTALDSEQNKATGLDLGADDYITKPFSIIELRSRVRALLRRSSLMQFGSSPEILDSGVLHVDTGRHLVRVGDETIPLSLKEYQLLVMLMKAEGRVCPRGDLLADIWGESYGESRTLDVHIRRIRSKLGAAGAYIQTVKGVGYKLEKNDADEP